ncbi:DUF3152 domain-containing protein [Streptomyces lavendofoliae]|uniref:DUF3152 domain-containing protein n=1 Tax=Streptomyces lavendofoliae TaxID=67314 RepID=UPI00300E9213
MGRHSRKGPAPQGSEQAAQPTAAVREGARPGTGRRRRTAAAPAEPYPSHHRHPGPPPQAGAQQHVRGGHPEQPEPGTGRGEPGPYGDRRGVPAPGRQAAPSAQAGPSGQGPSGQGPSGARPAGRGPSGRGSSGEGSPGRGPSGQGPSAGRGPAGPSGPEGRFRGPATGVGAGARIPGPRREFVEAFDGASRGTPPGGPEQPALDGDDPKGRPGAAGKGRTLTGIAAAAVTTVLAVVVAGQVAGAGQDGSAARPQEGAADRAQAEGGAGARFDRSARSDERAAPPPPARRAAPVTYERLMAKPFPLDPEFKGPGEFEAVPGTDRAPGKGRKVRYRIDVEKGLGLDAGLFARAVQQTLNDDRSWAHGGAMTFERVSSGEAEFVVTLASPVTTGVWCAKSGLDTTVDNVSCDSAATERVMINAYRWAQGSATYGVKAMHAYRQMLINHEVGHRLGHNHVNCRTPGALAPVMQQQTKSLEVEGVKCRPNPWVFPKG